LGQSSPAPGETPPFFTSDQLDAALPATDEYGNRARCPRATSKKRRLSGLSPSFRRSLRLPAARFRRTLRQMARTSPPSGWGLAGSPPATAPLGMALSGAGPGGRVHASSVVLAGRGLETLRRPPRPRPSSSAFQMTRAIQHWNAPNFSIKAVTGKAESLPSTEGGQEG
jgi:hypothetical protein